MKDVDRLVLSTLKTRGAREKYVMYLLRQCWPEIVGPAAAVHSQPYRLDKGTLFIHTDNPAWSHNLWLMKGKLLAAILPHLPKRNNQCIVAVKELRMFHGIIEQDAVSFPEDEGPFIPKVDSSRHCPVCGVPLIQGEMICSACARKEMEKKREKIQKVLRDLPWISYEDCRKYVDCDKMTFTDVKAALEEWSMSKALGPKATAEEKTFAVMLIRGIPPEKLTDKKIEEVLEKEKRIRFYVPAPGK
jgi:predicted nucleic acid-binding Zn ribbon protein